MNKIQSWPVACSLRYLWYLYIPLLRALSLRIFTRSQVGLNARWKVSENVFRMFDSTFSFVIFKILKFNFRNCCPEFSESLKIWWKNSWNSDYSNSKKFDLSHRATSLYPVSLNENSYSPIFFPTGYYFFICSQLVRGKEKEKQVNREFRGCCGEPVEFSSVKSLSGLRFRCAFCGPATSCQT